MTTRSVPHVSHPPSPSPFGVNNVSRFIAFRVFFNCRFYYPVFTVLFLDFGISVAQFAILNAVWAATIVLAEVPSGVLADVVGRKRLLVFAAFSMVVEMLILCLAPRDHLSLLFGFFVVNRILSGLAEAAASGVDEAIAYDALQEQGMADQWGRVLDRTMRLQSIMFILTMMVGAAVYDADLMSRVAALAGWEAGITPEQTLRLPIYLTLVLAVLCVMAVLGLDEIRPPGAHESEHTESHQASPQTFSTRHTMGAAVRLTLATGRWILKTPFVLVVILYGMLFDGILRMTVTLASQYYRMIQLPESSFGLMGSAMSVAGIFIPRLCLWMAENRSPAFCLGSTVVTALSGLCGMAFFWPYIGLVPALIAFSAMTMTGFYVSYFVNQKTSSFQRATVLSFKGLACNISYGMLGIFYAGLLEVKKSQVKVHGIDTQSIENMVFTETFFWFPVALAAGLIVVWAGVRIFRKQNK
ncbi:MFS transporter [Desulfosarcina sp. OttesenSCG-928-A07]|nr:MFS transporter [Desulfosarcina sp. OttesenSCG-928-G17]MDL2328754.1 MFS transporter [Desulfosarcina sp. OttesenSCG-928-A07]